MSSPSHALDFATEPVSVPRGLPARMWGMVCGAAFVAARASLYLLVVPVTLVACLAGIGLYGVKVLLGGDRG